MLLQNTNFRSGTTHLVLILVGTTKAPSFQIGSGWNLAGMFFE